MTWTYETERGGEDGDRLHIPEVAGLNPVPATRQNGPRRTLRGPFSCPLDTDLDTLGVLIILTIASGGWVPHFADEECGRLLRGVSVIVSQDMPHLRYG